MPEWGPLGSETNQGPFKESRCGNLGNSCLAERGRLYSRGILREANGLRNADEDFSSLLTATLRAKDILNRGEGGPCQPRIHFSVPMVAGICQLLGFFYIFLFFHRKPYHKSNKHALSSQLQA